MSRRAEVLIVDDREVVRETLVDILSDFDCACIEASDGSTALTLISERRFDVLFLDLKLPDISGIEVLRRVRRRGYVVGKIIVLTGLPEPKTEKEAAALGAFRYLKKSPIDWKEVRTAFSDACPDSMERPKEGGREVSVVSLQPASAERRASSAKSAIRGEAQRRRLLVLDDNQLWLDAMEEELSGSFELTLTRSVERACWSVGRERFDLVILDMRLLNGVSGLDVLTRMRRAVPDLRATILTERPDIASAVEALKRGALDYVPKNLASLRQTMLGILAEKPLAMRVFLSYERADRAKVQRLHERLTSHGYLPWMDVKNILGGRRWEPEVQKAIEQCERFVFCLSRHSARKEGAIRRELSQALNRQAGLLEDSTFLIPVRLDECEIESRIGEFHCVDLFKRDGFVKLLQALSAPR